MCVDHRRRSVIRLLEAVRGVRQAGRLRRAAGQHRRDGRILTPVEQLPGALPPITRCSSESSTTVFRGTSPGSASCSVAPTRSRGSPPGRLQLRGTGDSPGRQRLRRDGPQGFFWACDPTPEPFPEDLFVLLHNVRNVFALGDPSKYLIDEQGIKAFMGHCGSTLGADFYLTPRDAVKAFVGLLSVIEQNPGTEWRTVLSQSASSICRSRSGRFGRGRGTTAGND